MGLKKIINTCLLVSLISGFSFFSGNNDFKTTQLKSQRVRTAYQKNWKNLQELLASKKIDAQNFDIYLRAFKQEGQLEVWARTKTKKQYVLLKTYAICAKSGGLGPKRRLGDGQVPEGFYRITAFNPYSAFHLSLQVDYPNKSDLLKATGKPGGEIMIHGNCVTIGCIPIEDEPIEELYVLCVETKNKGRTIYTDIYPCHLTPANEAWLNKRAGIETLAFWESLKKAYDYFEQNQQLPRISISAKGDYLVEPSI